MKLTRPKIFKKSVFLRLLSFNGYSLLAELNDVKSRAGIYVKNGIDYVRRADLELRNNGKIVLDINMKNKYRLIICKSLFLT